MGRQTGNYGRGKQWVNGYMKKEHRFGKEMCCWDSSCNTSTLQHRDARACASAWRLKQYKGQELCLGLPEIECNVGSFFSLLARGMSVSLASCWCKVPSMCGLTTRRGTTKWRTLLDSNQCRDTSFFIQRCYSSARNGRRTQMAMRRQLHTALKIH